MIPRELCITAEKRFAKCAARLLRMYGENPDGLQDTMITTGDFCITGENGS